MTKTIEIHQDLDMPIEIKVNPAFASVQLTFETKNGERAVISLDMESTIKVLRSMDNGKEAIPQLKREYGRFRALQDFLCGTLRRMGRQS